MSEQKPGNQTAQRIVGQFADYSELGRLGDWNLGFRQLEPGPQSILASVLDGKRITLMGMKFSCRFHQSGCAPPGKVTFGLPVHGMKDWFGRHYKEETILPFNYASGVDGVSRRDFEAYTMSIDEAFLREISDLHRLPVPDYLLNPLSGSYIPNSQSVQNLRRATACLLGDQEQLLDDEQEAGLVIAMLMAAVEGPRIEDKSTPAMRARAIRVTMDFIAENQHEALTVGGVCAVTGVTWRTLDRAFKERFSIGPKAYLQRLRLSAVRDQLSTRSGNSPIADIANSWGFWHMGQFARDYRRMFGELPSDTFKRNH
jgi:AraC-like DNA-binding protein